MSKSSFFSGTGVSTTNTTALESSTAAAAASESAAAVSATSAASSASSASANVATNAASAAASEASRQAALVAKTAAETAETNAETAQAAALISQNAAATSAASSETSKVTSVNSASTATTKASEASTSETNAAASAATATSKAADSETARAASVVAKDASVAAKDASVVAKDASVVAKNASVAAQAASETAETNSETAETNAASSASSASTSASTATTKASEASTSATASETSKVASEAAKDAALAALDSFDDRYLGSKSSAPTVDNDGDALAAGMLYFDTTSDSMKVYEGSAWVNAYASLSGALIATNNLSDLNNAGTARTNLGLGTAATTAASAYATAAQGTKVDGIEDSATADQSNAEIRAAVEAATDSNVFTDADHTKLNSIEASADATDTTNVTAAGALMDSELTSIASVKALNQGVSTTDSPAFTGLELNGTEAIQLPSGTTAQRPTAAAGKLRFNSTTGGFEGYTSEWASLGGIGDEYISATPTLSSSANNQITVSNHSSYASPIYIVKIGNAVIQHTIASNVITLVGVTLSEQTISVTVTASETGLGKLFSNATVSMVVTDAAPTPALSITGLTNRKIQVTNHASYGSGIVYTAKIGSTVVSHTMDSDTIILADNTSFASDQTVAITASVNGGTSSAGANATVDMGGANYQYYRLINILAVQGTSGVALSEIALSDGFTANYNSFTTGSTNITASYSHSSYPVSNATGATAGYWWSVHGHNNTSTWVKFSFSQATVAKAIRLRAASSTYIATTFKFQGSNDDVNWTDIGTFGAPQYNNHTVTHDINKD